MPYIQRNDEGLIVSLTHLKDEQHKEYLTPTHIEIVEFLTGQCELDTDLNSAKETLQESDQDFARATEDLIQLLIEKNLILFTELPTAVQTKMLGRKKLRSSLGGQGNSFLDDGESI